MRAWGIVRTALFVVSATAIAATVNAATWYVAPSGNDANPGTIGAPFKTITKASSVAGPGDIVNARGGVYNQLVVISSNGTPSARVTIRAYPGEQPIIDGQGLGIDKNVVTFSGASYIDFSGFEVRNATRIGICGWGTSNIRVLNNTVHDCVRNGIYFGYDAFGQTSDITISGNTVYRTVLENQNHNMAGGWATALVISWCERGTITNNHVYQNQGEGLGFLLSNNGVVEQNDVHDNFSVEIYIDNSRFIRVNGNLAYSTGDVQFYRDGNPASGIGTANETYSASNPLSNLTITNNIVLNSHWGFYYGSYGNGGGLKSSTVANNTFYRSTAALLWIDNDAHAGNVIENNIFDQVGGVMTDVAGAGVTYLNNQWFGGTAGGASGSNDILGDPHLTNAGGLTPADYKLTPASPGLGLGSVLSTVTSDYWGVARTTINDIGAHQLSAQALPDTTAPTSPANLAATALNSSQISLTWTASTDVVGVTAYRIYRDGALVTSIPGTAWTDNGLAANTSYSYTVDAGDAARNVSAVSKAMTCLTFPNGVVPGGAVSAPLAAPSNLVATPSANSISLQWPAVNGAVAYRIYRDGMLVASTKHSPWTNDALLPATTFAYQVAAVDAAGIQSTPSTSVSATTLNRRRKAA